MALDLALDVALPWENSNSTNGSSPGMFECVGQFDTLTVFEQWVFIGTAGVIILLHICMAKRKASGSHIAVPVPINFLQVSDYKHRVMYCLAFGGASSGIYNLLAGTSSFLAKESHNVYFALLVRILSFLLVGLLYYPIFISIGTSSSILGSAIGFMYTGSFLAFKLKFIISCPSKENVWIASLSNAPGMASLFIITVHLFVRCCSEVTRCSRGLPLRWAAESKLAVLDIDDKVWQTKYVHRLLNRVTIQLASPVSCFHRIIRRVYDSSRSFQYSMRILTPVLVATYVIYYVLVLMTILFVQVESIISSLRATIQLIFNWLIVSFFCATVLAGILAVVQMYNILRSYRTDMLLMYRGKHASQAKRVKVANISMKPLFQNKFTLFTGYQAAVIFLGFTYQLILLFIICTLVSFFPFYAQYSSPKVAWNIFFSLALPIALTMAVYIFQHLIVYFVFMENRGKHSLIIDNRRTYHNFAFFIFFYNMLVGLLSAIVRVVFSFFMSSLMVSLLSVPVVARGYESWDWGYGTYTTFLYMENELTNPVMVVFCRLLLETQGKLAGRPRFPDARAGIFAAPSDGLQAGSAHSERAMLLGRSRPEEDYGGTATDGAESVGFHVSRLARNRWRIAVMMIRNPSITAMRRGEWQRSLDDNDDLQTLI